MWKIRGEKTEGGDVQRRRGLRFRVGSSGATGSFSSTTWTIPAEKFDEQVQEMVTGKFR